MGDQTLSSDSPGLASGTMIVVFEVGRDVWPPQKRVTFSRTPRNRGVIELSIETTGQFHFSMTIAGVIATQQIFQPIRFEGKGLVALVLRWGKHDVPLEIDKSKLSPASLTSTEILTITVETPPILGGPSIFDDSAADACAARVHWRAKYFENRKTKIGELGQRSRSLDERLADLMDSQQHLSLFSQMIRQGINAAVRPLSAELRALLYYAPKSYDPLLLRLTHEAKVGLPVYADSAKTSPVGSDWMELSQLTPCKFWKTSPNEELVDFQDWLERSYWRQKPLAQKTKTGGDLVGRPLELIKEFANTYGSAHYGTTVSEPMDYLTSSWYGGRSVIVRFLMDVAEVCIPLIDFVMFRLGKGPKPEIAQPWQTK